MPTRDQADLNPPLAVAYRRLNQWFRRQFFRYDTPMRRRLWRRVSQLSLLSTYDNPKGLAELGRVNWTLGRGSVYRFTPAQLAEQEILANQIIDEILAEERAAKAQNQEV